MKYLTVKMHGVFPPERAITMRPAIAVLQRIVDGKEEEIAARVREQMLNLFLYGEKPTA